MARKRKTSARPRAGEPTEPAVEAAADAAALDRSLDDSGAPERPDAPAPMAVAGGEEPPRRPRRRRGGRRRKTAGGGSAAPRAEAGVAPPAPVGSGRSSDVRVERADNAVVIRFGPAKAQPSEADRNEAVAGVEAPPPAPAIVPSDPGLVEEGEAEDALQRAVSLFEDHAQDDAHEHDALDVAPDAPAAPPLAPPDAGGSAPGAPEDFDMRRLSPSQRRRLRRRRRAQRQREAAASASSAETPPSTDQARAPRAAALGDDSLESPSAERAQPAARPRAEAERDDEREGRRERPGEGRRGRRRRRPWQRDRDDEAGATDAEEIAGIVEPEEESEAAEEPAEEAAEGVRVVSDLNTPVRREMIINVVPREECRIAILESGKLEEIYFERASAENLVGNIYKGLVTNVEASIQAAFVDFGLGKNGFLHISDLHPQYFPSGERHTETVGRKMPRRSRPPIQRCLRRGQEVLVQITKEGIGTKGPTLSTYLSIPGRFLVMMPGMRRLGVSRKIDDDEMRDKLRSAIADLDLPDDMGFIARTAAQHRTKRELQSDLNYLSRLWRSVDKRIKSERAPAELYRESDLVIRTIRDVFSSDIDRIVTDDPEVAERAREFLSIFSPRSRDAVVEYTDPTPIFHRYGIEAELERLHSRHVPLRSGGSLVIDQTEALVAIDVNSGKFRAEDDAETTAFKINLEAADEIPRQLRLRDLGGVIICDFIDMRLEPHRREIEKRLIKNLKQHKERAKILRMSAFGIIEMTRQRQRASLTRSVYEDCHHCRGTGLVKTAESVALDVLRLLQLSTTREQLQKIEVTVSPRVADLLLNRKRSVLHALETRNRRTLVVSPDTSFGLDQVQIHCYDARGRLVPHP